MAKETGQEQGIPPQYRWDALESLQGLPQLDHDKELLLRLGSATKPKAEDSDIGEANLEDDGEPEAPVAPIVLEIFANASTFIKKATTLTKLVSEIDKLDWYSARQEGLGDLYEGLLQKNAEEKKSGAGQYFTPRPLIDAMVAVMQPTLEDVIQRRTQSLFSLADQLEAKLTSARRIVERLTPALLAKAFRGELVPQDPSDEPASVLLERIRAARQADSAAGKPSRRGRRQAAAHPAQSAVVAAPVPSDLLSNFLRECGSLSEKALLAASEDDPARFGAQLELERRAGGIQHLWEEGEALWEACPR